ncbi:MAG: proteophosphoglycan ppg4 [Variovorax sp.]|nr:MAG: proteophosphoglycan ppg4 [Variovorax sp.]
MSNSTLFKASIAAATLAFAGASFAQGTPPNPNVSNPALGAGQQTQQGTPMGTTGVPAAGANTQAAPMAAPAAPAQAMPEASTTTRMRPARADRN